MSEQIPEEEERGHFDFLRDLPRTAVYIFGVLLLLLISAAIFNIYVWQTSRQTAIELRVERQARLTQRQQDARTRNIGRVTNCYASIPILVRANAIVIGVRDEYRTRAAAARALAKSDIDPAQAKIHNHLADSLTKRSKALVPFVGPTKKSCHAMAVRLHVEIKPPKKPIPDH